MDLRIDEHPLTEPEESTPPHSAGTSAHLLNILRVSQLQTHVSEAKAKLARISRETEAVRKRVKTQMTLHRSSGATVYTQGEVNELMALVVLLEDENSQLRAISAIPVEIERLKADLKDLSLSDLKDTSCSMRELQSLNASLRTDLEETQARLRAAEQRLVRSGLTEPEVTLAIPPSKSLFPASPATKLVSVKLQPHSSQARQKLSMTGKVRKTRGYSPTFLRVMKCRKKLESASPARREEDHFADCFPDDCEGSVRVAI